MQQHSGQRRPWQNVGASSGNRTAQARMSPPEKRLSPNTPSPSHSHSPSSANNNNNHQQHNQHDRMLTGGSLPSSPQNNMQPGAPYRQDQGPRSPLQMSPVRISQLSGQLDARERRIVQPNRRFVNTQEQQPNIRNFARVRTVACRARNRSLQIARNNNINLTPPEHIGNKKKRITMNPPPLCHCVTIFTGIVCL